MDVSSDIENIMRDKVTVLMSMENEKKILQTIKRRKMQYLGHIMREVRYHLLRIIIKNHRKNSFRTFATKKSQRLI